MYYPKLKNQFEYLKQKTKNKGKINATVFRVVSSDSHIGRESSASAKCIILLLRLCYGFHGIKRHNHVIKTMQHSLKQRREDKRYIFFF